MKQDGTTNGTTNGAVTPPPPSPQAPKHPTGCTCPDAGYVTAIGSCLRCHAQPDSMEDYSPDPPAAQQCRAAAAPVEPPPVPAREEWKRIGTAKLAERLDVDRTTIERWIKAKRIPTPHYVCDNRKAWWLHEIEAWEAKRMRELAEHRRGNANVAGKGSSRGD